MNNQLRWLSKCVHIDSESDISFQLTLVYLYYIMLYLSCVEYRWILWSSHCRISCYVYVLNSWRKISRALLPTVSSGFSSKPSSRPHCWSLQPYSNRSICYVDPKWKGKDSTDRFRCFAMLCIRHCQTVTQKIISSVLLLLFLQLLVLSCCFTLHLC